MRLTSKRQVTVPIALARAKGLGPGDEVEWRTHKDGLLLRKARLARAGTGIVERMLRGGRVSASTQEILRLTRGKR